MTQVGKEQRGRAAGHRVYESTDVVRGSRQAEGGGRDLGMPQMRGRRGC